MNAEKESLLTEVRRAKKEKEERQQKIEKLRQNFATLAFQTFRRNRNLSKSINPEFGKAFSEIHALVLSEALKLDRQLIKDVKARYSAVIYKNKLSKKDRGVADEIEKAEKAIGSRAKITWTQFRKWEAGSIPEKKSIVKYAIVCRVDLLTIASLLRAGGYQFNLTSDKEYAWAYLIMFCSGQSLAYCNKKLEALKLFDPKTDSEVFLDKRRQRSSSTGKVED